ncbi:MAG: MFS transporter [Bacteroidota bacterium]
MQSKWWILLAIGIGSFLSTLSTSIVNAVLPVIGQEFQADLMTIQWVITIFLLVISGLLLGFGRLGDLHGHRRVYLSGLFLFALGSALCALAPTVPVLIAFRALQAIGAAMLFSNGPAILTRSFPPEERGKALGMQATLTYLGLMTGPPLGGWLAAHHGWPSIFLIPLPVSLLAFLICLLKLPRTDRGETLPFDWLGAGWFFIGLTTLLLGLNQGNAWGWNSAPILALFLGTALTGFAFLRVETKSPHPLLDFSLFRSRVLSRTMLAAMFNYVCTYALLFLLPFYLMRGLKLDPAHSGWVLMVQPLVMAIVAPISGALSDRIPPRWLATVGMLILALGMGLLSRLGQQSTPADVVLALAVAGFGTGMFTTPNNNALMGAAPRGSQGVAAGILATARNVGMALGVGVAGAIFSSFAPLSLYVALDRSFLVMIAVASSGALASFFAREKAPAIETSP